MDTPFQRAKKIFDDEPEQFWRHIRTFLEWGHIFGDGKTYFCLAAPVNTSAPMETWDIGDVADADAWYIHLFAGEDMEACWKIIFGIHNLPKIVFFRYKRGEQSKDLKIYDAPKFLRRIQNG